MGFRFSQWRLAAIALAVVAFAPELATGQSNQEWIALKQKCGIPAGTAYNDWVAAGAKCNSGSTATGTGSGTSAEQLGTTLGNMTGDLMLKGIHNMLHGTPARPAAPIDLEQQQRALAANQLNNSGIYLLNRRPRDFAGAINEFQKALQQTPNDATIASNLEYAKRLQKESAVAGQTSNMLGNLLGDNASPGSTNNSPAYAVLSPRVLNPVNVDPNVVDFRGMFPISPPGMPSSYLPAANANALHAVLTGSDAGVVDLSGATRTSVDPKSLQRQIDGIFGHTVPVSEPPDPMGSRAQAQEIGKIFQSPQATAGTKPIVTEPKPAGAEKQTKEQIDNLFSTPDAPPHN
jgi:hypothetical protein